MKQVARETGISRPTLRKMLRCDLPPKYARLQTYPKTGAFRAIVRQMLEAELTMPSPRAVANVVRQLQNEEGYRGGYDAIRRYIASIRSAELKIEISLVGRHAQIESMVPAIGVSNRRAAYHLDERQGRSRRADNGVHVTLKRDHRAENREKAFAWMHACSRGALVPHQMATEPGFRDLNAQLRCGSLRERTKALAVCARAQNIAVRTIAEYVGSSPATIRKYAAAFAMGGVAALYGRRCAARVKTDDPAVQDAIFGLLHEPPSLHGINRTSWTMADLSRVLAAKGRPACVKVISKVLKAAGYRWRKARVVLTSNDPDYAAKLAAVQGILSGLSSSEAFFSIDEFGPFAIKMKQGSMLEAPGAKRIVPQWQKSKGRLIMTAALELSSNQVTHFFSAKKNTDEMIRMLTVLLERYADRTKIFLSWDAASWHMSKKLCERIACVNAAAVLGGGPLVEMAPLPAGAQFLNVIESVFSGMARAIIHNSDYPSAGAAKGAIDRYFAERNDHYRLHPKRAGKKIWGKERVPAMFSEANNCKDPHFR